MSDWLDVCGEEELATGEHRMVDADGVMIAVFRLQEGYAAIEDVCTHDYVPFVEAGAQVEDGAITCPFHGARFCLRSGAVLMPPAYEELTTFPVRLVDGRVQVRDDRWD